MGGLKVMMMLLSDWDNKDARDENRGSNTAIYQKDKLLLYFIDDWGGAMGAWGKYLTRSKWDAEDFYKQSSRFVTYRNGQLDWGYVGQHTALMTQDIKPGDIVWLMQYLGRVSDDQFRAGLLASGASEKEADLYVKGLRLRIAQLQQVTAPSE
jgi:hypothetical protein